MARRVSSPADADDVIQEVFLRLLRGLPTLREEERSGPWVYQVARNAITDHRRRQARNPPAHDDTPELPEENLDESGAVAEELLQACWEIAIDARGRVIACEPKPAPASAGAAGGCVCSSSSQAGRR